MKRNWELIKDILLHLSFGDMTEDNLILMLSNANGYNWRENHIKYHLRLLFQAGSIFNGDKLSITSYGKDMFNVLSEYERIYGSLEGVQSPYMILVLLVGEDE